MLSEHDVFLADDRIITRLPAVLGKVFYKGTVKRPISVSVANVEKGQKGSQKKSSKSEGSAPPSSPSVLAKEIEKAISCVPVSLRPGTLVAVRIGLASFKPEQLRENIATVVAGLIEKHVAKGWRNVRGIHIKGQSSFAVPIWLADDLWTESDDITATEEAENGDQGQKRKRNPVATKGPQAGPRKRAKAEDQGGEKDVAGHQAAEARKTKLAEQKARIFKDDL